MSGFLPRPPLEKAMNLANRDVRTGKLTASELAWLYEHPVTWLQSLVAMEQEVQAHLAKSRLALAEYKPDVGEQPSQEYASRKKESDLRQLRSRHYLEKVRTRRMEVASLFGYDLRKECNDARLIDNLVKMENLLEQGDSTEAADVLARLLDDLEAAQQAKNGRSA